MADIPIHIEIALNAPLLITARQVGLVWESEPYIPGAAIRGGQAGLLLPGCSLDEVEKRAPEMAPLEHQEQCAFHRLFYTASPPRFGHAYPGIEPPVGVLPLTARSCKRHRGFKRDDADEERHGVFDVLIRQVLSEKAGVVFKPLCPDSDCEWKVEPFIGRVYALRGRRYVSPRALPRRLSRTAVAREGGAVAEGLLYTLEALGEQMDCDELDKDGRPLRAQTTFHVTVWVDEVYEQEMRRALRQVRRLGAAISRGLGQVTIKTRRAIVQEPSTERLVDAAEELAKGVAPEQPMAPLPKGAGLIERVLAFNRLWAHEYKAKKLPTEGWYFTVDLQADALLRRADGPVYRLTPELLRMPNDVKLVHCFTAHRQIGGWSSAWGLPKPTMPALVAGSVFLYQVPGNDAALAQQVLNRLATLEREGVGQRREEGYGWLQVCTPFHLEMEV